MVIFVASAVMTILGTFIGLRSIYPLNIDVRNKIILCIILIILNYLPLLNFWLRFKEIDFKGTYILSWIAYTSLGFLSLLFALLIIKDIMLLLLPKNNYGNIIVFCTVLLALILTAYGIYSARMSPEIVTVNIPIKNLPAKFNGFTIAQLTDIHVGETINKNFIKNITDKANSLNADMIAITGDIADGATHKLRNGTEPLKELKSKYGVFFVTGNHEYYSGVNMWIKEVQRLGMTVLNNEYRILSKGNQHIIIAGVPDYNGLNHRKNGESSPAKAIEGAPAYVKILLAHQPRSIFDAAAAGYELQLSGHTHGGQYYPWVFFVQLQQPFIKGLHKVKNTWIYTSKGTCYWGPPLRIGVPSEITKIVLVKE